MAKAEKRHHWLVAGKVVFTTPSENGDGVDVGNFEHNTTITNTQNFVPAQLIGQAQQALQMELFGQMPHPHLKMVNVHIQGISYLGYMTKEEFYTPPPVEAEVPTQPVVDAGPNPFKVH